MDLIVRASLFAAAAILCWQFGVWLSVRLFRRRERGERNRICRQMGRDVDEALQELERDRRMMKELDQEFDAP